MSKQLREAAQEALAALELHGEQYPHMVKGYTTDATTTLRAALAEPERQPMTEKQVENLLWESEWPEVLLSDFVRAKLRFLMRAVERHHGIAATDQKEPKCD